MLTVAYCGLLEGLRGQEFGGGVISSVQASLFGSSCWIPVILRLPVSLQSWSRRVRRWLRSQPDLNRLAKDSRAVSVTWVMFQTDSIARSPRGCRGRACDAQPGVRRGCMGAIPAHLTVRPRCFCLLDTYIFWFSYLEFRIVGKEELGWLWRLRISCHERALGFAGVFGASGAGAPGDG